MIEIRLQTDGLMIPVRVTPNAGRESLLPFQPGDEQVKVKVTVPPEDGKANEAVIRLLAKRLNVVKSRIEIVSGETSRNKRLRIQTGEPQEVLGKLAQALGTHTAAGFMIQQP